MKKAVLSIDLGGTNMRMAAVGEDGAILAHAKTKSENAGTPEKLINAFASLAEECGCIDAPEWQIVALGIGVPANFDADGVLTHVTNLPELTGMNLKADLTAKFRVPVILENDATAAAIGENWIGASRDVKDSIMLTLGTGVGGGVIINNEPLRGIDGTAGRLGHICVEPDGHPCGCGSWGCIEQYASATAIVRMARENGLDVQTSFEVYELCSPPARGGVAAASADGVVGATGDERALAVFKTMGRYLGITLGGLVNTLNPEMIVLGGGVATGMDAFVEHLRKELDARAFHEPAQRLKIVKGKLLDNAGIIGAARSALDLVLR